MLLRASSEGAGTMCLRRVCVFLRVCMCVCMCACPCSYTCASVRACVRARACVHSYQGGQPMQIEEIDRRQAQLGE